MNDGARAELLALERGMPLELILFYRQLAEAHGNREAAAEREMLLSPGNQKKIVDSLLGFCRRSNERELEVELEGLDLSDDQHAALATLLDDAEEDTSLSDRGGGETVAKLTLCVADVTISLTDAPPPGAPPSAGDPLHVQCQMRGLLVGADFERGRLDASCRLEQVCVVDQSAGCAWPHVLVQHVGIVDGQAAAEPAEPVVFKKRRANTAGFRKKG